ncbi:hypothetical protein MN116_001849 [Schistosoma mekongi]|uniref:Uncharacterized protein n=1 Tax=Schistosoma mekongi TaxID=38744 RepID=A0AAE1ZIT5_SCHME|nr:hypothetical protein MN116_001849 [Schistosoma mekongi]
MNSTISNIKNNIENNESKCNSSLSSSCRITDLCAWCQKPNRQTYKYNSLHQSVNEINYAKHEIKPVPVCCSQICFDNLRRAYFKNRRHQLNQELLDEIPAMAISGRLPYTSDSDKEKLFDVGRQSDLSYRSTTATTTTTNNISSISIITTSTITTTTNTTSRISSNKQLHSQQFDRQFHSSQDTFQNHIPIVNNSHLKSKSITEEQNYDLVLNLPLYPQLNSCSINKEDIEISTQLYEYFMQRINVSQFVNNFVNAINIDHIPITTMTNSTTTARTTINDDNNSEYDINIHSMPVDSLQSNVINPNVEYDNQLNDSSMEMMNLIKQLMNYTNENDTIHNNQYDMNCFNQSFIIPIPIPIFKTAPDLLNVLHRYGYHSIDSCKYYNNKLNMKDASTQINKIILDDSIENDNDNDDVEQNKTNEYIKLEFIENIHENTENALDLSLSSKTINNQINEHFTKRQKQQSLKKQQQRCHNKRCSYRKQIRRLTFSGIYRLIHPVTKHCYTVRIIPIRQ